MRPPPKLRCGLTAALKTPYRIADSSDVSEIGDTPKLRLPGPVLSIPLEEHLRAGKRQLKIPFHRPHRELQEACKSPALIVTFDVPLPIHPVTGRKNLELVI